MMTDIRYAFRLLRKSPVFSATVIFVLALGIGANSAIFSIVDAVLLRGLPYREPQQLVMVWEKNPALGSAIGDRVPAALSNFLEWQKRSSQFEVIGGFEDANLNLTNGLEPERIDGARASPNFFDVLGVTAAMGTTFSNVGDDPGASDVVMLSDGFYHSHFGGETNVLGQKLMLNDIQYTIVGVLPATFHLPASREGGEQRKPQLWIPYDGTEQKNAVEFHRRKMQVYARLKPSVTLAQARAEMDAIAKQLAIEDPTQNAGFGANIFSLSVEDTGKDLRRNLLVLLGAVGFVLLIVCANVANLMLTRTTARNKELAIRKALGASRGRLIRQMLCESALLALLGAGLGLFLADCALKGVLALRPAGINRPEEIHLSGPVLLFTIGISALATAIFGLIPAFQTVRSNRSAPLDQTRVDSTASSGRVRKFLIVSEVAAACILLVGAGFMIKSMINLAEVRPGFRPDHLLTMKFSMPASRYSSSEQVAGFCRQVLEKLTGVEGVKAASFSDGLPLTRIRLTKFTVDGRPEPARGSEPTADMRGVFNAAYFDALGIPLLKGRNFSDAELRDKAPVIIVNQTLAAKLWPNDDAVGKHLRSVASKLNPEPITSTVIGVVGDTHQFSLESAPRPEITRTMQDFTQLTLAVRTSESPAAMVSRVKTQVWTVDKYLPVYEVQTMEQVVASVTSERRFESFLMSVFAGLALLLVVVGVYGVLASLVAQRTAEIGVRMALGAQRGDVLRLIIGEGVFLVSLGLGVGILAGTILSHLFSGVFFGVNVATPMTYLEVILLMLGITVVACYIPAARAARTNPMNALRHE
jgi:putative ABC transport system permease protein